MIAGLERIIDKYAFFKPTIEMPHYNQLLEEGKAVIVYMNAEKYILECMNVHNYYDSMQSYINKVISPSKVKHYRKCMASGIKFPIPVIDYVRREQEGRHRMLAFNDLVTLRELNIDTAPVVVRKLL